MADLIPPAGFCCVLQDLAGTDGSVVYLPITFTGCTEFVIPTHQTSTHISLDSSIMERIALTYDEFLVHSGHYVSQSNLIRAIGQYGGKCIEIAPSDWNISAASHCYMWIAMYRFILLGALFPLLSASKGSPINAKSLITCFRILLETKNANIIARNVDILFKFPPKSAAGSDVDTNIGG